MKVETLGANQGLYRGYIGILGYILALYRDDGKENSNYSRVGDCFEKCKV